MQIDSRITPKDFSAPLDRVFELAAAKVRAIDRSWDLAQGTPVYTVDGTYTTRGWTEWTQSFQYGCALLCFDATGDKQLLEMGRSRTVDLMAPHVSHIGVHDHGFNNLSTYGNLRRLMLEGRIKQDRWELAFYELALKTSAAVQAARWSSTADGLGYIYSFNGPHSLFIDTIRTTRILGVGHQLGHVLMGENDARHSLLGRSVQHGLASARYNIWYGEGRDRYDQRGRTAHEAIFNRNDGNYRCPNAQQGFSGFTTWTRGLAWAVLGYAEELEFLASLPAKAFTRAGLPAKAQVLATYKRAALATADFFIDQATASDGITYWDTGAPRLHELGDWQSRPADPFNQVEPVDSSASAIAAQGLVRLGVHLGARGKRYLQAGLTVARTLCEEPYLSTGKDHQGLLLHQIYHEPNGWDHKPAGSAVAHGESALWGDYHLLELAVLIQRLAKGGYLTFFDR